MKPAIHCPHCNSDKCRYLGRVGSGREVEKVFHCDACGKGFRRPPVEPLPTQNEDDYWQERLQDEYERAHQRSMMGGF